MFIEMLKVISDSWPICFMLLGFFGAATIIYGIRSVQRTAEGDRNFKASNALVVRDTRPHVVTERNFD